MYITGLQQQLTYTTAEVTQKLNTSQLYLTEKENQFSCTFCQLPIIIAPGIGIWIDSHTIFYRTSSAFSC